MFCGVGPPHDTTAMCDGTVKMFKYRGKCRPLSFSTALKGQARSSASVRVDSQPRDPHSHRSTRCHFRVVNCKFERIGCSWRGPFHELAAHEGDCVHPNKRAEDIMDTLACMDSKQQEKMKVHHSIFNLLSFEKITFSGMYGTLPPL